MYLEVLHFAAIIFVRDAGASYQVFPCDAENVSTNFSFKLIISMRGR